MSTTIRTDRPFVDDGVKARDFGLLILRLALGAIFIAHGGQKMFGWFGGPGLEATVSMMGQKMGVPAPLAYLAAFTEFFGGVAVVIGLLARLASLGLAVVMVVAIAKVHGANGFFAPAGYEYNLALLGMALALVFTGPGRIALADVEARFFGRKANDQAALEEKRGETRLSA